MEIYKTIETLRQAINNEKDNGKQIGFVPTMGAIHDGHLSLVKESKRQSDITVVSIFVNPTQFNDPKDLEKYPRTIESDIEKLESVNADMLFLPDVKEIYPEKDTRTFDFGNLDKVMEGKFRSGHFNGVAQVVSRLFEIVEPDKAFFGQKDFQQYVIIKALSSKYMSDYNIEIVRCPIVREKNGLAMSSRNMLLTEEQRKNASTIYKTLKAAKENFKDKSVEEIKNFVVSTINKNPYLKVEYFSIVDDVDLEEIKDMSDKRNKVACVAVYCGEIRLIDNIYFD